MSVNLPEVTVEGGLVPGLSGLATEASLLSLDGENGTALDVAVLIAVQLKTNSVLVGESAPLEGVLVSQVVGLTSEGNTISGAKEAVVLAD